LRGRVWIHHWHHSLDVEHGADAPDESSGTSDTHEAADEP
jgi:hypothetical protein